MNTNNTIILQDNNTYLYFHITVIYTYIKYYNIYY